MRSAQQHERRDHEQKLVPPSRMTTVSERLEVRVVDEGKSHLGDRDLVQRNARGQAVSVCLMQMSGEDRGVALVEELKYGRAHAGDVHHLELEVRVRLPEGRVART